MSDEYGPGKPFLSAYDEMRQRGAANDELRRWQESDEYRGKGGGGGDSGGGTAPGCGLVGCGLFVVVVGLFVKQCNHDRFVRENKATPPPVGPALHQIFAGDWTLVVYRHGWSDVKSTDGTLSINKDRLARVKLPREEARTFRFELKDGDAKGGRCNFVAEDGGVGYSGTYRVVTDKADLIEFDLPMQAKPGSTREFQGAGGAEARGSAWRRVVPAR